MGLNWQHCKHQLSLRELDSGWKPCSLFSLRDSSSCTTPLSSAPPLTHFLSLPENRFSSIWSSIGGGEGEMHILPWIAIGSQLIHRFSTRSTRKASSNIVFSNDLWSQRLVCQMFRGIRWRCILFLWFFVVVVVVFPHELRNDIIK